MSERPPLRHVDVSPLAAVSGLVVVTAVVASVAFGVDTPLERALAVVVCGALALGVLDWLRRAR